MSSEGKPATRDGSREYEPVKVGLPAKVKAFAWGFVLGGIVVGSVDYFVLRPQMEENVAELRKLEAALAEMGETRREAASGE